jgi:multiple sugar transport system substrate-binding protein
MTEKTQTMFAHHHGQPAHVSVWGDPAINKVFGDCFESVRLTQEAAWLRPRFPGYLGFQARAGDLVEAFLRGTGSADTLIDVLSDLFGRSAQAG